MTYRLLIDYEVVGFIETLFRKDYSLLRNRFSAIRDFPRHHSDYTEYDSTGRRIDINICGKWAIKFWVDDADQHIKILDLHLADNLRR